MTHTTNRKKPKTRASAAADAPRRPRGGVLSEQRGSLDLVRVGTWNVRTMCAEGCQVVLADELSRYGMDFVGLQETRLTGCGELELRGSDDKPAFTVFYSGGVTRTNGVGLAVRKDRIAEVSGSAQCMGDRLVSLNVDSTVLGKLTIIVTYAPTNVSADLDKDAFYDSVSAALGRVQADRRVVVLGDFNAVTGQENVAWPGIMGAHGRGTINDNGLRLLSMASASNLCVANTCFPHQDIHKVSWVSNDGRTQKQLDYVLISKSLRGRLAEARTKRGADCGSDHHLVQCTLRGAVPRDTKPPRHHRRKPIIADVKQLKRPQIAQSFVDALGPRLANVPTWTETAAVVVDTAVRVCGKRKPVYRPWVSARTLEVVTERREAKNGTNRHHYDILNRRVKRLLQEDRIAWINNIADDLDRAAARGDMKTVYDGIRTLSGGKRPRVGCLIDEHGNPIQTSDAKLERWATHFCNLLNRPEPSVLDNELHGPQGPQSRGPPLGFAGVIDREPSLEEVAASVRKLKAGKAGGEDGVVAEMLIIGGDVMVRQLHALIVDVWRSEVIPQEWKDAVIVALHKKGSTSDCANYRGISLLSIAGKVFARILAWRIEPLYAICGRQEQAGFCAGRGCVDQIFGLRQIIEKRLRYQRPFLAVFIDFSSAFDSVHRGSLWNMMESDGVPVKIVRLFTALYTGSKSCVRAYGEVSRKFDVCTGVRQGCVASPALFKIAVDRVMSNSVRPGDGVLVDDTLRVSDLDFADDLAAFEDTVAAAEATLQRINDAGELYGLKINVAKTKVVAFGFPDPVVINLNGTAVEQVPEFKYLGSVVSEGGGCVAEIVPRIARAAGVFGQLHREVWASRTISTETKVKIYRVSVLSVLLYSAETWTVLERELSPDGGVSHEMPTHHLGTVTCGNKLQISRL